MCRLEDEKNFARKDASSKLALLIKKTYYNIENVSLQTHGNFILYRLRRIVADNVQKISCNT